MISRDLFSEPRCEPAQRLHQLRERRVALRTNERQALEAVTAARAEHQAAVAAAHDIEARALAFDKPDTPADAMLDFANALQEAISGRVDKTGTMAEVWPGHSDATLQW